MHKYIFAAKNTENSFCNKMVSFTYFVICRVSYREAGSLTESTSLGGKGSRRESGPLTGRPCLSQGNQASHREAVPLSESRTSHREAVPLTGRRSLLQGGWASHRVILNLSKILINLFFIKCLGISYT